MKRRPATTAGADARGSGMLEFALVAVLCCLLMIAVVELGRMMLVYNAVAGSARAGVRYAIVHGSTSAGGGSSSSDTSQVEAVVRKFAGAGLMDVSRLSVAVTYSGGNSPGSLVDVKVVYPYDPLAAYLPLRVNLGSTSEGVITF